MVAEIAGIGVWRYEDSTGWQRLTSTNAAAVGIDSNGDVAGVFSGGVWRYEDSTGWKQLFNPGNVTMVGIDSNGDIAGEVSGLGMWRYEDSTGWKRLTPTNASAVDFA